MIKTAVQWSISWNFGIIWREMLCFVYIYFDNTGIDINYLYFVIACCMFVLDRLPNSTFNWTRYMILAFSIITILTFYFDIFSGTSAYMHWHCMQRQPKFLMLNLNIASHVSSPSESLPATCRQSHHHMSRGKLMFHVHCPNTDLSQPLWYHEVIKIGLYGIPCSFICIRDWTSETTTYISVC